MIKAFYFCSKNHFIRRRGSMVKQSVKSIYFLRTPTIIHIIYWLVSCIALYLIAGISLPAGIGSLLSFLALFVSLIVYYLGVCLVILTQLIALIRSLFHAVKHKVKSIPPTPDLLWQIVNIGINMTLLVLSPYHKLLIGWLSL